MCGFVGILHLEPRPVEFLCFARMGRVLEHRGPDDEGSFIDGPVGFYHKRLSIIDLTSGHQPMTSDGVTVVFNGEIYNYVELRNDLIRRGTPSGRPRTPRCCSGCTWSTAPEFVRALNGMFAFLLYDSRTPAAPGGPRSLRHQAALLLRRSVAAALRLRDQGPAPASRGAGRVDFDSLRDYITFQFVLGDRTMFKGVRKLLPGQY